MKIHSQVIENKCVFEGQLRFDFSSHMKVGGKSPYNLIYFRPKMIYHDSFIIL